MLRSDRETVELFHLCFVRVLSAGGDKLSHRVKGGCNLRFFFGSIRYSEDLDLDVVGIDRHVLKDRIDGILAGHALNASLASMGIELLSVSAPKQTDKTQRWKAQLRAKGRAVDLHSRIEFSRRSGVGEIKLDAIDPRLVQHYKLMPILACHYLLPAAIRQKIGALVGRREVQARDVFDLSLLFSKTEGDFRGDQDLKEKARAAIDRALSISYGDYKSQVVAYLVPEQAEPYASEEGWTAIQRQVIEALEKIGALP